MSLDGKITKWDEIQDVSTWASKEDQDFFHSQIAKHKVIVMGRKTYEAVKHRLKMKEGRRRIVMTSQPQEFEDNEIKGQFEFTSETPEDIVARLKKEAVEELLVVGGGSVNTTFLKAGLVDELYLTIEPKIFGKGKMLVSEEKLDIKLKLLSVKQINKEGALLLHYQ